MGYSKNRAPRKNYRKKPAKKNNYNRRKSSNKQTFKNKVLAIVNKGRELKKLWSNISASNNTLDIPNGERLLLFTPTATLLDTSLPAYPPIQSLGDTAENYFREGNQVQPVMFRCKGYAYIKTENVDDKRLWALPSKVRLVAGFRNRNTPLSIFNNKM